MGYDVLDIFSGEKQTFLRISGNEKQQRIGKFYMYSEGSCLGKSVLQLNTFTASEIIIIDEIGRLELSGKGWHDSMQNLFQHFNGHLLLSARKEVVNKIIQQYELKPESILEVSESICDNLSRLIIKKTKTGN
jgi:nucleoside-triphosphatase THEP1